MDPSPSRSPRQRVNRIMRHLQINASECSGLSPPNSDYVYYFGFGSNLSVNNFSRFKNIKIISLRRGIIKDWKLSFSLCYPTKSFANIHQSKGDEVHGVVLEITKTDFQRLQTMEASYRTVQLQAYSYDNNQVFNVYTFIFDKECEQRIKREIRENRNVQQVTRFFDANGGGKKPEKNYLDTIICGAMQLKLHENYIKFLRTFESIPTLLFDPTPMQLQRIHAKIWNLSDIERYLAENPNECVSILKGIVFDMAKFPPSWKPMVRGKDITMTYAKRWAFATEENSKSMHALQADQKLYINGEVQKLLNGVYDVKILGKMNASAYLYAFDNYKCNLSQQRGILKDWKLSFSLCYPTKCFANIHASKGDEVHGAILKLHKADLQRLKACEMSYRLIALQARPYEARNSCANDDVLDVYTFIFDKQCENEIRREMAENPNAKQVVRYFDISGDGKKPARNYLDTIIRGAKDLELEQEYIARLEQIETNPILELSPTQQQLEQINSRIWTMSEIEECAKSKPNECISVFKGVVFDMADYPASRKPTVNGKDMTMWYAKRWAFANEGNCKSVECLEYEQQQYLNGELQKLLNGIYHVRILGKIDANTYEYNYDNYRY